MTQLRPCPHRLVDDEGHILCQQIKHGEREVSPAVCRACPIAQINCTHLRATLDHRARTQLTIRWGNGKTEIWDDPAPPLVLARAACAAKTIPILSPRDCTGCALRQSVVAADALAIGRSAAKRTTRPLTIPIAPPAEPRGAVESARTNLVAQKIIQLQEWLTKSKSNPRADEEDEPLPLTLGARTLRVSEERRVGWTD